MPKLTKRIVDAAAPDPNGGELFLWDSEVKGFGVRVKPSGSKSFVIKYRLGSRTKRYTISKVGSPYTVDEARKIAGDILRGVRDGIDPAEQKRGAREAVTVGDLVALYLAEGPADKPNKKEASWKQDGSNLHRHVVPLIGGRLANSLTAADIAKFQRDIAVGKTAADEKLGFRSRSIVTGGKGTAARTLAVLGAMLEWATGRKLIPANPTKGVKPYKGESKERFLSEGEVATLAEGLSILEELGMVHKTIGDVIRLLAFSGCRKNEIASLKWDGVDFERGCLRIAKHKTDSTTGAKVVPLAAPALKLLADRPRGESAYVFPRIRDAASQAGSDAGTVDGHVVGIQKAWEALRVWCGLDDVRLHDLRHSFASFAAADGASLFLIGKILGHTQARTTERYAHLHDDPLRVVADRTAGRIAAAFKVGGEGEKPTAEVVPLPRKKA